MKIFFSNVSHNLWRLKYIPFFKRFFVYIFDLILSSSNKASLFLAGPKGSAHYFGSVTDSLTDSQTHLNLQHIEYKFFLKPIHCLHLWKFKWLYIWAYLGYVYITQFCFYNSSSFKMKISEEWGLSMGIMLIEYFFLRINREKGLQVHSKLPKTIFL